MKIMMKVLISILLCLVFTVEMYAQALVNVEEFGCKTIPVLYVNAGVEENGVLLFVRHKELDLPFYYTNVFLLNKYGNKQLLGDDEAFTGVNEVLVSEDYKYLAVSQVAEGHPWVDIYDLQVLISTRELKQVGEVNPYPGAIDLKKWSGNRLIVLCDINLELLNEKKELMFEDSFDEYRRFSYDIVTKRFKELGVGQ